MPNGTTDVPPPSAGVSTTPDTSFVAHPLSSTTNGRSLSGSSSQVETTTDGRASPASRVAQSPRAQQPQPNAFTAPRPLLVPLQEYHSGYSDEGQQQGSLPSQQHRRQPSYPNLLSSITLRSRTPSPTRRSTLRFSEHMPLTGDGRSGKADSPKGGFAGWLSSMNSSPDTPNSQKGAAPREMTPDTTPTGPPGRRKAVTSNGENPPKTTATTTASRFMWAISRFTQAPVSPTVDDELCNINIETELFFPGSPTNKDPFSPAAFKNLQTNAVGLLTKMQNAYRQKVAALRDLEAEKGAQTDELEEAETRSQHLKMQLEGMARKAQDQEKLMKQLMDELAAVKKARAEERSAREKGITILREGSVVSEDLGVDEDRMRQKWRKSADTVKSDFDTDEESAESESVFSRSRSPTLPPTTFEGASIDNSASRPKRRSLAPPKTKSEQPMNAFQKILKGMSGETEGLISETCRNCKGQDASMAWDTVSLLRDENRQLKQRVGELEVAVEGALDLVNGIGM